MPTSPLSDQTIFSTVGVVWCRKLNALTLLLPIACFIYYPNSDLSHGIETFVFLITLLSLVPFAERLGYLTENLTIHTSPTFGGLINATFGNASELIFSLFGLRKRMYRVVQLSLLGSILSNLLLVLGTGCLLGGLRHKVQRFQVTSGSISPGLLLVSMSSLVLPCALKLAGQEDDTTDEINFSRGVAVIMVGMYILYMVFMLRTHRGEFEESEEAKKKDIGETEADIELVLPSSPLQRSSKATSDDSLPESRPLPEPAPTPSEPTSSEEAELSYKTSIIWLFITTICVAVLSDILVGTIEGFTGKHGVNPVFVAAVVIPIFGNAAEHAASVLFAWKNKMDISVNIAIGSSIQISLLCIPLCVVSGWATNREFSLFFEGYETACLMVACTVVCFFLVGGTSNWLIGGLLIGMYLIISMGFWVHKVERLGDHTNNGKDAIEPVHT